MSQKRLNRSNISPLLEETSSKAMSQGMRGNFFVDTKESRIGLNEFFDSISTKLLTKAIGSDTYKDIRNLIGPCAKIILKQLSRQTCKKDRPHLRSLSHNTNLVGILLKV